MRIKFRVSGLESRVWATLLAAALAWPGAAWAADMLVVLNKSDDTASILDAGTGKALATVAWHRGDFDSAEALFRQSLATFRKVRGPDDPDVSTGLNNLALVLADRRDYAGAESMLRESLAIGRRTLGDQHPRIAAKLNNLPDALREEGKYAEAASTIEEALRIAVPALGNHPQVATYKITLARVDLARKEPQKAEPLLRQALQIRQHAYPRDDWRVGVPKSLLGETLTALGRYGEAEHMLLEAHSVLKNIPGQQGREATATLARLVALYEASGRPEKAKAYRRE